MVLFGFGFLDLVWRMTMVGDWFVPGLYQIFRGVGLVGLPFFSFDFSLTVGCESWVVILYQICALQLIYFSCVGFYLLPSLMLRL